MSTKNKLCAEPQPEYTIRFIPELGNVFDAMKQIRLLFDDVDVNMDSVARKKLAGLFYGGLKLFSVNGQFDATTLTQDVIMRGKISQCFFDYMSTLRAVKREVNVSQI